MLAQQIQTLSTYLARAPGLTPAQMECLYVPRAMVAELAHVDIRRALVRQVEIDALHCLENDRKTEAAAAFRASKIQRFSATATFLLRALALDTCITVPSEIHLKASNPNQAWDHIFTSIAAYLTHEADREEEQEFSEQASARLDALSALYPHIIGAVRKHHADPIQGAAWVNTHEQWLGPIEALLAASPASRISAGALQRLPELLVTARAQGRDLPTDLARLQSEYHGLTHALGLLSEVYAAALTHYAAWLTPLMQLAEAVSSAPTPYYSRQVYQLSARAKKAGATVADVSAIFTEPANRTIITLEGWVGKLEEAAQARKHAASTAAREHRVAQRPIGAIAVAVSHVVNLGVASDEGRCHLIALVKALAQRDSTPEAIAALAFMAVDDRVFAEAVDALKLYKNDVIRRTTRGRLPFIIECAQSIAAMDRPGVGYLDRATQIRMLACVIAANRHKAGVDTFTTALATLSAYRDHDGRMEDFTRIRIGTATADDFARPHAWKAAVYTAPFTFLNALAPLLERITALHARGQASHILVTRVLSDTTPARMGAMVDRLTPLIDRYAAASDKGQALVAAIMQKSPSLWYTREGLSIMPPLIPRIDALLQQGHWARSFVTQVLANAKPTDIVALLDGLPMLVDFYKATSDTGKSLIAAVTRVRPQLWQTASGIELLADIIPYFERPSGDALLQWLAHDVQLHNSVVTGFFARTEQLFQASDTCRSAHGPQTVGGAMPALMRWMRTYPVAETDALMTVLETAQGKNVILFSNQYGRIALLRESRAFLAAMHALPHTLHDDFLEVYEAMYMPNTDVTTVAMPLTRLALHLTAAQLDALIAAGDQNTQMILRERLAFNLDAMRIRIAEAQTASSVTLDYEPGAGFAETIFVYAAGEQAIDARNAALAASAAGRIPLPLAVSDRFAVVGKELAEEDK